VTPFAVLQEAGKTVADARLDVGFGISLSDPWALWLLVLVPLALATGFLRFARVAGRVPRLPRRIPRSPRQVLAGVVPLFLQGAALVCAIWALARPLRGNVELSSKSEGIDIALLLDRSSSMEHKDNAGGPRRFDVAKRVVGDFAVRRMNDREGAADNVALFGFARFTELLCPFTLDADALTGILAELDIEPRRDMDGTGIGVAVAEGVAIMKNSDAKSRVIVLLTDGEETISAIHPLDAAAMAAEEGVKLYTVFAGPKYVMRYTTRFNNRQKVPVPVGPLPKMAELTGGEFFHASDEAELEAAYTRIEELERTEREELRFAEHFDLYYRWVLVALGLYAGSVLSRFTWARRIA
jgi:Ca-activated chloride channel family protein